jgi:uncharacterized membrane protein
MNDLSPPATSPVTLHSPWRWLGLGWADLRRNPLPGLVHGLVLTAFGWLLLWAARDQFWLLAGAFSGFLIVAPILATGLYQVSRQRRAGLGEVVQLWRSGDGRLVTFGLLLGLAGTGWVLTSAGLITLGSPVPILKPLDFLRHVVLVREIGLFEVWLLMGALLAAPVFASTVVALPMLVDTRASVMEAVAESWRAATGLLGLIVLIPLLAHASWHAYRDLTARRTAP